jgi:hypothetical protein
LSERSPIPLIRITRPYRSEGEFIDGDLAWLGRSSVILPNGPIRPEGELVRFEIMLDGGMPVLRGEGHVVAHHTPSGTRPPGLEVRFTRIDARSKLLLDRVGEKRSTFMPSAAPVARPSLVAAAPADVPSKIVRPQNRDEILERLRARARGLGAAGVLAFKRS